MGRHYVEIDQRELAQKKDRRDELAPLVLAKGSLRVVRRGRRCLSSSTQCLHREVLRQGAKMRNLLKKATMTQEAYRAFTVR